MIISRSPLRVSFLGGGTDFPAHFRTEGGAVLSTAVDAYVYVTVSPLLQRFHKCRFKLAYSQVEQVETLDAIRHPAIREALRLLGIDGGVELHTIADLPSSTGLGGSSSFVVGMLQALHAHAGRFAAPEQLAHEAIRVERELLHEPGGVQDQIAAAFGGLNLIEFGPDDAFHVHRVPLSTARLREVEAHALVLYTGITRNSFDVHRDTDKRASTADGAAALRRLADLARLGVRQLESGHDLAGFGELLHEGWEIKRRTSNASLPVIDAAYATARAHGAIGGKLLGAGQGGFLLLWATPERHADIVNALPEMAPIHFALGAPGATLIHAS